MKAPPKPEDGAQDEHSGEAETVRRQIAVKSKQLRDHRDHGQQGNIDHREQYDGLHSLCLRSVWGGVGMTTRTSNQYRSPHEFDSSASRAAPLWKTLGISKHQGLVSPLDFDRDQRGLSVVGDARARDNYLLRRVPTKVNTAVSLRPGVFAMADATVKPASSTPAKPQMAIPSGRQGGAGQSRLDSGSGSGPNALLGYSLAPLATELRQAMIAEVAYYIAEQQGFESGHDLEHWLRAEKQINAALSA